MKQQRKRKKFKQSRAGANPGSLYACLLMSAAGVALSTAAQANPQDGVVVDGNATISSVGKTLDVQQTSNRVIIDWRSFDIAHDELTEFHQPDSTAVALNRVKSADPSQIAGHLKANGNVVLINPNGVFFSSTAKVDVNGLLATTADIDNKAFMAGSNHYDRAGQATARIVNEGEITAREAGLIGLVAPQVENSGIISARLGRAVLASGDTVTADFYGDGLVEVALSDAVSTQLVKNSGTLMAEGGTIQMTAASGRAIVDGLVDAGGLISAPTARQRNGRVIIEAKTSGSSKRSTVLVRGQVKASGQNAGESGGQIDVLADQIALLDGSALDVSGAAGGGQVRVGGEYQGQGDLQRANRVIVQQDALINADAGTEGDGGRVIVWSDDVTTYAGRITARGGSNAGNGGFVETSGYNILEATGNVDASAVYGNAGQWLLDPNNITIQASGSNTNITGAPDFTTTNNSAILTVASIQAALNGGTSVTVTTGTAGTNNQNGDITVASSITKSAGGDASLTLRAHNNISLSNNVAITSTNSRLNVTLNADRDASGAGAIVLNSGSSILSNGGHVTLGGGIDPLAGFASGRSGTVTGINLNNATINAGGGNISLRGKGYNGTTNNYGVLLQAGAKLLTNGAGSISVTGQGGVGTTGNRGVYLTGSTSLIQTENGAIVLTGQGGGTTTTNEGILVSGNAIISATGTGNISLTGHAGGTTIQGVSLSQTSAIDTIKSNGGNVLLRSNQTIDLLRARITSPGAVSYNIILNADADANGSGRITLNSSNLSSYGGNITLGGGADAATGSAVGVSGAVEGINLNASVLNAAGGNISLRGTGYTAASASNFGVYMQGAAQLRTSGSGNISITGTGGAGTNTNYGIYLTGTNTLASVVNGQMSLTGLARGSGTSNYGIVLAAAASLAASGNGALSLDGRSSATGTTGNRGVVLTGANTRIEGGGGSVSILGQAGGTTTSNEGFYLDTAAYISLGTGNLDLTGHAGGTTTTGINLNQTTASNTLRSGGGNVVLRSAQSIVLTRAHITALASAAYNITLNADSDANGSGRIALTSSNLSSYGGNITLGGGSDAATGSAVGISGAVEGINLNASVLNAAGGNISLRGTGFNATANAYGVVLQAAAKLQTNGSGNISVWGTGGSGTTGNRGIYLTASGTEIRAVNGDISLIGQGRGTSGGYGIDISTAAAVVSTGSGGIALTGYGSGAAPGFYSSSTSPTIGNTAHTGSITINTDLATWGSLLLRTAGSVTFAPVTGTTSIGVAGGAGALGITAALLNNTTAATINIGRYDGTGLITLAARTWTANAVIRSGNGQIAINGMQTMASRRFIASAQGTGNITIGANGGVSSTASGDAIVLATGGNLINSRGASALSASGGRWLIYTASAAGNILGGLSGAFQRYSCTYGGSCPSMPASGNGLLYSYTPTLTITPLALAAITYGDAAPTLSGYSYSVAGYLAGDAAVDTLSGSLVGSTSYVQGSDAGLYDIDYASGSLSSALGYGFSYASLADGLSVNKRVITASVQDQGVTYGSATPVLDVMNTAHVQWGNLYGTDTASVLDSVAFTYGGATPGANNGAGHYALGLTGFSDNNYELGAVSTGTLTVSPYLLTVQAASYRRAQGAADPVLNYTYSDLVNGDDASIFSGSLQRSAGEQPGTYQIGQGSLIANANYILSFIPGSLIIVQSELPPAVSQIVQVQNPAVTLGSEHRVRQQLSPASIEMGDFLMAAYTLDDIAPAAGPDNNQDEDDKSPTEE